MRCIEVESGVYVLFFDEEEVPTLEDITKET